VTLPFSRDAFLDVFAAYNQIFWPVALTLWLATAAAFIRHVRRQDRAIAVVWLLAIQWAWAGAVYHAIFFSRINPAAWVFSALFIIEALLLVWNRPIRRHVRFSQIHPVRYTISSGFIAYSLAVPDPCVG
jgi:hypothetical protein